MRTLRLAVTVGVAIGTFFLIVCYVFAYDIVNLFGVKGELEDFAVITLCLGVIFFPLVGFHAVGGIYFQSSGQPIKSAVLELTRQVIFLIPMYLTMPQILLALNIIQDGLIGVVVCPPIADFFSALLTIVFVAIEVKKLRVNLTKQRKEARIHLGIEK